MNEPEIQKNSIAITLSREMLLDFRLTEPTPEEAEQRRLQAEAWAKRKRDAQPRLHAALAALDAITNFDTRAILDLHRRENDGTCYGCDFSGYEGEPPAWPCRTVELIAQLNDIDLSDFHLYDPTTEERP